MLAEGSANKKKQRNANKELTTYLMEKTNK